MAKLQSTLTNMLLSLTIIALAAAALLAGIYTLTAEPIAASEKKAQAEAKLAVLPIEGVEVAEEAEEIDGVKVYRAMLGDEQVGAAIEVRENGFGGEFAIMVGLAQDGTILGYKVLNHQETPGLGSKMQEWFSNEEKPTACIMGMNPAKNKMTVSKDGGDVEAITAATISSRAFLNAIQKAYNAYAITPMPIEATSGASIVETTEKVVEVELNEGKEANNE